VVLAKRAPSARRTYGLRKGTILASLTNAALLLVAVGAIAWEAVRRFADPEPVQTGPVMIVAAIGIVINTATALMFMKGSKDDLNVRGAFLHMAADAAVSAGVVVAAVAMMLTGWLWLDPSSAWASSPSSCWAPGACCATRWTWPWTPHRAGSTPVRCATGWRVAPASPRSTTCTSGR
jgi:cation diffusion facilitator family transporter